MIQYDKHQIILNLAWFQPKKVLGSFIFNIHRDWLASLDGSIKEDNGPLRCFSPSSGSMNSLLVVVPKGNMCPSRMEVRMVCLACHLHCQSPFIKKKVVANLRGCKDSDMLPLPLG